MLFSSHLQLLAAGYDTFVLDGGWSQGQDASGNATQYLDRYVLDCCQKTSQI